MKVSKAEKAEHRDQIIAAAARAFREKGFDGISVADLMKEAGLTHGGFYGHFASKEELVGLAAQRALRDTKARWIRIMEAAPDHPLEALTRYYLSARHRAHPESGCLLSALGSELARQPREVRELVTEEQEQLLSVIGSVVPGATDAARRREAISVLAQLVGGMVLARNAPDKELSDEILEATTAGVVGT
jgi:TetR/AcrR family transcriptional regulator, transcriptional repressor for nem operon